MIQEIGFVFAVGVASWTPSRGVQWVTIRSRVTGLSTGGDRSAVFRREPRHAALVQEDFQLVTQ